ncbi:hypothetical protein MCOO_21860 [Mycobacterium cookii]|uniref:DUF559 domain-containing protein n=2 Tax=Mycobacterium cookii TaxID=1775 RepID=A0A7I7KXA0_9MYCO|nr:hypothetical protein MCOO_21860 [Mycobacterium cookii]
MTIGAWLWSGRRALVTGRAASALYGARWVGEHAPVELLWRNNHCPPGIIVRSERFQADEVASIAGISVATPARVAYDLARHLPRTEAVAHLDALAGATGLTAREAMHLIDRYPGARGNKRARQVLDLMDAGAESPRESWLRLVVVDAGLPRPVTQIRVTDGQLVAYLDMGWRDKLVALEYDGDQHRTDRRQYVKDIRRAEMFERLGWHVIKVIKEDRPRDVVARVSRALGLVGDAAVPPYRSQGRDAA